VGEVPGFTTAVYVLPSDGLAFTVLVNASPQEAATGLLALRILYDVLGVGQPIEVADKSVPNSIFLYRQPECPPLLEGRSLISGMQLIPQTIQVRLPFWTPTPAHTQTQATATLPSVPPLPRPSPLSAILSFPRSPASKIPSPPHPSSTPLGPHLRITHLFDTQFGLEPTTVFPQGYGRNQSAFELSFGPTPAEFGLDERGEVQGLAIFGLRKRTEEQAREDEGKGLEEKADVWFVKV
jgi:hypothetical protein